MLLHFGVAFAADPEEGVGDSRFKFSDMAPNTAATNRQESPAGTDYVHYPNCVSHDPGRPRKPIVKRPGDIIRKDCPSDRYCMNDLERAGHPNQTSWWAKCAVNENYSAWFVGGGTPWIYPRKARARTEEEGTWGLDYDGIFRPRRVWINWSCGREQGGLGSYKTDGAPAIIERFKLH